MSSGPSKRQSGSDNPFGYPPIGCALPADYPRLTAEEESLIQTHPKIRKLKQAIWKQIEDCWDPRGKNYDEFLETIRSVLIYLTKGEGHLLKTVLQKKSNNALPAKIPNIVPPEGHCWLCVGKAEIVGYPRYSVNLLGQYRYWPNKESAKLKYGRSRMIPDLNGFICMRYELAEEKEPQLSLRILQPAQSQLKKRKRSVEDDHQESSSNGEGSSEEDCEEHNEVHKNRSNTPKRPIRAPVTLDLTTEPDEEEQDGEKTNTANANGTPSKEVPQQQQTMPPSSQDRDTAALEIRLQASQDNNRRLQAELDAAKSKIVELEKQVLLQQMQYAQDKLKLTNEYWELRLKVQQQDHEQQQQQQQQRQSSPVPPRHESDRSQSASPSNSSSPTQKAQQQQSHFIEFL